MSHVDKGIGGIPKAVSPATTPRDVQHVRPSVGVSVENGYIPPPPPPPLDVPGTPSAGSRWGGVVRLTAYRIVLRHTVFR